MDALLFATLLAGGVVAGVVSSVAGGASFLTFPLLMATGLSPMTANVTNWVALTPGNFMATAAYRGELRELSVHDNGLRAQILASLAGGGVGSALLFWGGEARFERAVPWLMLTATLIFAMGDWLRQQLLARRRPGHKPSRRSLLVFEFALMIYGGYFGAGLGILLLAVFTILGETSLHRANARKNLLVSVLSVSVIGVYLASGHVVWRHALPIFVGAMAGGYWGVRATRKVPEHVVRQIVLLWAGGLTGYMFWRYG
jgi:uncharacterized membrane protein YfcA